MRKNVYVRIPANWLSEDYDLFPMLLRDDTVVLCTKNPYRFHEPIFKIVPMSGSKKKPKEARKDENP